MRYNEVKDLPDGKYDLICADPPWSFLTRSDKGKEKSPEKHYECMTLADIKALPVANKCKKDAVLLIWVVDPLLDEGIEVLKSWGFKYKTVGFYWTKLTKKGKKHVGCGYYTRANPEQCILATRGKGLKVLDHGVRRWVESVVREHSRKPDEVYEGIKRLFGEEVTCLDMFARRDRDGWDVMGNEL